MELLLLPFRIGDEGAEDKLVETLECMAEGGPVVVVVATSGAKSEEKKGELLWLVLFSIPDCWFELLLLLLLLFWLLLVTDSSSKLWLVCVVPNASKLAENSSTDESSSVASPALLLENCCCCCINKVSPVFGGVGIFFFLTPVTFGLSAEVALADEATGLGFLRLFCVAVFRNLAGPSTSEASENQVWSSPLIFRVRGLVLVNFAAKEEVEAFIGIAEAAGCRLCFEDAN